MSGLKGTQIHALERIYRRRVAQDKVVTPELARFIAILSWEIGRQIGLLIERSGKISYVIVGDAKGILIPDLSNYPLGKRPLRGLRLVHTHLKGEQLNQDDLTDLSLLRFDLIAAIGIKEGMPDRMFVAHLMPEGSQKPIEIISPQDFYQFSIDFIPFITALEREMERLRTFSGKDKRERAILVSVSTRARYEQEDSLEELKDLARSGGVMVLDVVSQRPKASAGGLSRGQDQCGRVTQP